MPVCLRSSLVVAPNSHSFCSLPFLRQTTMSFLCTFVHINTTTIVINFIYYDTTVENLRHGFLSVIILLFAQFYLWWYQVCGLGRLGTESLPSYHRKQRNYGIYKAKTKDALFAVSSDTYSA